MAVLGLAHSRPGRSRNGCFTIDKSADFGPRLVVQLGEFSSKDLSVLGYCYLLVGFLLESSFKGNGRLPNFHIWDSAGAYGKSSDFP